MKLTNDTSEFAIVLPFVHANEEDGTGDPAAAVADPTGDPTTPSSSDPAAAAATEDPAAAIVDPSLDPTTPAVPDDQAAFDKLFPKDDEPAAAIVDPNAPAAAVPEEITRALGVSEYVKDASQLENAVRAADEVFQVQTGRIPAHQMLEGFRARDPQGFEKIVNESLVPYLEHILGKKFGGETTAPDPMVAMQQEIERLKGQPQRDEEQRQITASRNNADTVTRTHVDGLIKAGSGIFDGATDDAISAMVAQLPKLGLNVNKLMADVNAGKTADLDRAYKAAEKAEMVRVKAMGTRLIARSKTLKAALPPGKGNPAAARTPGELPMGSTREDMVAYLKGA